MAEAKSAKAAKKPGFFKELITFLFVVALILGMASGAILYLSGKNLNDLLVTRPVAKNTGNASPNSSDQKVSTQQQLSGEGNGATDSAIPAAYPVGTPGQQNIVGGQVARYALPAQKGSLKGTITWQYNDYVGTKPDVNAKILLIRTDFDKNTITDEKAALFALGSAPKDSGLYTAKANGYGNYEIGNLPVGDYYILVVSGQTKRDLSEPIDEYLTNTLQPYARNWEEFTLLGLSANQYELSSITIEEDQTIDFSHDFGNTYF